MVNLCLGEALNCPHSRCIHRVTAAVFLLSQGFTDVQTASGSSCVASGASTESGGNNRNSNGSPTPAPTVGTGCQVANCAACRGAPTNCYLCKPVRSGVCHQL